MVVQLHPTCRFHTRLIARANGHAAYRAHRGVQVGLWNRFQHFLYIVARTTRHGVPLRPVTDLNQSVVVAEAHEGREWKCQHLLGRTRPNTPGHWQQVPITKFGAVVIRIQKFTERNFIHGAVSERHLGGLTVEAQDIAQHAPKARRQQITSLREHRIEVATCPLQGAHASG